MTGEEFAMMPEAASALEVLTNGEHWRVHGYSFVSGVVLVHNEVRDRRLELFMVRYVARNPKTVPLAAYEHEGNIAFLFHKSVPAALTGSRAQVMAQGESWPATALTFALARSRGADEVATLARRKLWKAFGTHPATLYGVVGNNP